MIMKPSTLRKIFGLLFIFFVLDAYGSKKEWQWKDPNGTWYDCSQDLNDELNSNDGSAHANLTCSSGDKCSAIINSGSLSWVDTDTVTIYDDSVREKEKQEIDDGHFLKKQSKMEDENDPNKELEAYAMRSLTRQKMKETIDYLTNTPEGMMFLKQLTKEERKTFFDTLRADATKEAKKDLANYIEEFKQIDMEEYAKNLLERTKANDSGGVDRIIDDVKRRRKLYEFIDHLLKTNKAKPLFEAIHFSSKMKCGNAIVEMFEACDKRALITCLINAKYGGTRTFFIRSITSRTD